MKFTKLIASNGKEGSSRKYAGVKAGKGYRPGCTSNFFTFGQDVNSVTLSG
ncbi:MULTISPECIES: hypothetical protein [Planktothricoides]|uniref:Uncharacterized protein n=2 Tax=Planktothricoides raciborskii TaxID=132608 RepID=A0AAU8JHA9_9CYAN|nr:MULTISPECIES: hypothetical protein [Planktothricoides]MBD2544142.1 hypothetical protein [Planktothricoides raciborskii FACHB-1370]MBD2582628.1 hypothetical protein [Planktothricoides raciborskii FACHB-1261]